MSRELTHAAWRLRAGAFLRGPFSALFQHRDLTIELTKRDVLGRYRGANFGLLWSLFGPLMMLVIYTVAFGKILGSRWTEHTPQPAAFGMVLFVGLLVHGFFAECFSRAPRLMIDNANYVKKIIFPLHILPWSMALSALFHTAMNVFVFVVLNAAIYGQFSPYILLAPLVMLPLVLLVIAVSWVMASLGVYLRDISQAVPMVVTAMLFLSSAIVPVATLPPRYQLIFHLNPLTFFIDQMRAIALWGQLPDWYGLGLATLVGVIALYLGYAWFRFTSRGFADVL